MAQTMRERMRDRLNVAAFHADSTVPGHGYDHIVSAILAELSNPTPEMTEAGLNSISPFLDDAIDRDDIAHAFVEMIAEAGK